MVEYPVRTELKMGITIENVQFSVCEKDVEETDIDI